MNGQTRAGSGYGQIGASSTQCVVTACERPPSALEDAYRTTVASGVELESLVSALERQLEPVMSGSVPEPNKPEGRPPDRNGVLGMFDTTAHSINNINTRLRVLQQRLVC